MSILLKRLTSAPFVALSRLLQNAFSTAIRVEVEGVWVAHAFQFAFRHAAPHPARAVQQQRLVFVFHTLRQLGSD